MRILKKIIFVCVWLAVCVTAGVAAPYPSSQGYVSDFAGVINDAQENQIRSLAGLIEQKTSAQIAVVTIQSLEGESLEYYANELFTKWGIGQKGKDNGILIILAFKERKVWIETGYGLEAILPDGKCGQISREVMIPHFKNGDYSNGLLAGAATIAQVIAQDAGVTLSGSMQPRSVRGRRGRRKLTLVQKLFRIIIFIIMAIVFIRHPFLFLLFLSGPRAGGFGGGGFSGGSGGFGGFGGGMSGGGGGGGSW